MHALAVNVVGAGCCCGSRCRAAAAADMVISMVPGGGPSMRPLAGAGGLPVPLVLLTTCRPPLAAVMTVAVMASVVFVLAKATWLERRRSRVWLRLLRRGRGAAAAR